MLTDHGQLVLTAKMVFCHNRAVGSNMSKSSDLAGRLEEVLLHGKWIAHTNIQEQLSKVDWKEAVCTVGEHNSIAQLAFHINYYIGGILNVLNGGQLEIRDKYSFDMKPVASKEDWEQLTTTFTSNARAIIEKIANFPEEQWNKPFVKEDYGSYARNIEGLIEHSYYHFGQISLLLKLISNPTNKEN